MKPDGPVAHRRDYEVRPCALAVARALVAANHYAKGSAKQAAHAHCLVRKLDGAIVGAALWLPPTKPAAVRAVAHHAPGTDWRGVLSLSRLVVVPGEPKNTAGLLLGQSTRLVARDPRWHLAVTYADEGQGHKGTIYRATGWLEDGVVPARVRWTDANGAQVATKSTVNRSVARMLELGHKRGEATTKIRFVRVLRAPCCDPARAPKIPPGGRG